MIQKVNIFQIFPRFILEDQDGFAMCKALEAGLNYFLEKCQGGIDQALDTEKMAEWRLDELAWEYNIPFDYTADTETKRMWVSDALRLSRLYGTPEGVIQYMKAFLNGAEMEENWQYDGDPFHFRMIFPDSWTPEKVAWATKAINTVKNLRSVLDSYTFVGKWLHNLFAGCALYTHEATTYQVPVVVIENDWYIDENSDMLLDENGILLIVE